MLRPTSSQKCRFTFTAKLIIDNIIRQKHSCPEYFSLFEGCAFRRTAGMAMPVSGRACGLIIFLISVLTAYGEHYETPEFRRGLRSQGRHPTQMPLHQQATAMMNGSLPSKTQTKPVAAIGYQGLGMPRALAGLPSWIVKRWFGFLLFPTPLLPPLPTPTLLLFFVVLFFFSFSFSSCLSFLHCSASASAASSFPS
eukprot:jgi/Botrbrau1/15130/Bobra.0149s0003.1